MTSLILILFWTGASLAILIAAAVFRLKQHVPQAFEDLLLYGKIRGKHRKWSIVQWTEVPKWYFVHFYVLGSLINSSMFLISVYSFSVGAAFPYFVQFVIEVISLGSYKSDEAIDASSAVLLIGLMAIHNVRRLYECAVVSIYSPHGTMNIAHYLLGIALYSSFSFAVIVEAPDPSSIITVNANEIFMELFHSRNILGILLFIWSSWQHNRSHVQLAELRKSKKGDVTSFDHMIPRGCWFELVSCPHYFAEILIYLSFLVIGGLHHVTLLCIVLFVATNQLVAGHLAHNWYRSTFGAAYPANRRAVLPFLF